MWSLSALDFSRHPAGSESRNQDIRLAQSPERNNDAAGAAADPHAIVDQAEQSGRAASASGTRAPSPERVARDFEQEADEISLSPAANQNTEVSPRLHVSELPADCLRNILRYVDGPSSVHFFTNVLWRLEPKAAVALTYDLPDHDAARYLWIRHNRRTDQLMNHNLSAEASKRRLRYKLFERLYPAVHFQSARRDRELRKILQDLPWANGRLNDVYSDFADWIGAGRATYNHLVTLVDNLSPANRAAAIQKFRKHAVDAASLKKIASALSCLCDSDFAAEVTVLTAASEEESVHLAIAATFAGRMYTDNALHAFIERTPYDSSLAVAAREIKRFSQNAVVALANRLMAQSSHPSVHLEIIEALPKLDQASLVEIFSILVIAARHTDVHSALFAVFPSIDEERRTEIFDAARDYARELTGRNLTLADSLNAMLAHALKHLPAEKRKERFLELISSAHHPPVAQTLLTLMADVLPEKTDFETAFSRIREVSKDTAVRLQLIELFPKVSKKFFESEFFVLHLEDDTPGKTLRRRLLAFAHNLSSPLTRGDMVRMTREQGDLGTRRDVAAMLADLKLSRDAFYREARALAKEFDIVTRISLLNALPLKESYDGKLLFDEAGEAASLIASLDRWTQNKTPDFLIALSAARSRCRAMQSNHASS